MDSSSIHMILFFLGAPFLTLLISVYLYLKFGPSSLIGIGIMIMFLPMQVCIVAFSVIYPSYLRLKILLFESLAFAL